MNWEAPSFGFHASKNDGRPTGAYFIGASSFGSPLLQFLCRLVQLSRCRGVRAALEAGFASVSLR